MFNTENYALSERAGRALIRAGLQLAVAESCTGGMLGEWVTAVPGSSAYFLGGVLSYSDRVKTGVLGVPPVTLREHGAVSAETAIVMARGVLKLVGADIALSVTGVAGPDGGTEAKPVGLTYIALVTGDEEIIERHIWDGDRALIREQSAQRALHLILETLSNEQKNRTGS